MVRDWLVEQKITITFLPTVLAEKVLQLDWPVTTSLRLLLTGADVLHYYPSPDLPFALINNYGPTEATVVATSGRVLPTEHAETLPTIGRPIDNTQIYILDEQMRQVPIGAAGELYIGGVGLALYNNRIQALEIPAAIGPNAEGRRKQIISLRETKGITSWVLEEKKPARVDNVHSDPQWRDLYIQDVADTISELDVPLLDGDEVVGVLNFESIKEGAFQQEDQDFLLTLAGQAVLAIKNGQAYEREKRLAEEGRVLNQISKEITSQLDPNHIFDLILEKALELTHSTRGNLMIYDRDRNDLWMASERGLSEDKDGLRQSLDEGIIGYVARHKQLLNVDLSQPPWNDVYLDLFPGTQSELAVPMLVGDELGGVLNVESLATNNYSERDERLLQGLADLAVIALQNAQAFEREKRLVDEGRVLNEISREITSQLILCHVFDLILDKALELTHSTWAI